MTVGQILEKSEDELLGLRNFGRKSYDELRDRLIELGYIEAEAEGLIPVVGTPFSDGGSRRPTTIRTSTVILDEDDEEESLSTLGKALKEALREVGEEELLGADDDD
jgi:DNA-directed RNA polymerase subunit alpha